MCHVTSCVPLATLSVHRYGSYEKFCICFQDILTLEEQEGAVNFKFGILYARAGQRTDDEMFSNGRESYLVFYCFYFLLHFFKKQAVLNLTNFWIFLATR